MNDGAYHIPVLLHEAVNGLNIQPDGIYVDATFGGGGHAREILNKLNEKGRLIAFDQDEEATKNAFNDSRFTFVHSNFCYVKNFLRYLEIDKVNGILADLGVSSHHFDASERGFSFRFEGKLDMRMNKRSPLTAADVLNTYSEEKLADIFFNYGELRNARKIAKIIVENRDKQPLIQISSFVELIKPLFAKEKGKKDLARVFQALRIEVNHELEALQAFLQQSLQVLQPQGRLVIITYHSLEDRMVKNFLKSGNFAGKIEKDFYGHPLLPFQLINNKVIVPDNNEIEQNPRARSAKLRIAERKSLI
ncbi:MAG TPA: 16S rRNA (cytosine(1402)-N(4))-methyltransferase RsmH [Paludibacteraceae bacterium]|nr:16S rRNA (cytosine(1402)-N(4))-methyltransferase RsmH [Paludibacteraceae bacterium]